MKFKRFFSFSFAFFLIAFQPFEVYASSGLGSSDSGTVGDADAFYTASGSVDGHVALTAFLSASGIYLKAEGNLSSATDVSIQLDNLWSDFVSDVSGVASSISETGASIVRGGLAIAKKSWNGYCKFAEWLKNKFSLNDNSNDVPLYEVTSSGPILYTEKILVGDGYYSGPSSNTDIYNGAIYLADASNSGLLCAAYYRYSNGATEVTFYNISNSRTGEMIVKYGNVNSANPYNIFIPELSPGGHSSGSSGKIRITSNLNPDFQIVTANNPFIPPSSSPSVPDGFLSVDSSSISVPDEIPQDAQGGDSAGGLLIPAVGAGLGGAAGAIAGNIMQGVLDGVMPDIDIRPADVKVPPGMEIDDDGNVFPSDVEFRPTDVFLDSDAYKLDSLNNYFPFSIPWDLLNFAAMFRAEPEIPIIDFVVPMPDGIDDITIHVDLTPFDSVAILSRSGLFVLFAIRWLMFLYRKFG